MSRALVVYLHGMGATPNGVKAELLRHHLGASTKLLAPRLSQDGFFSISSGMHAMDKVRQEHVPEKSQLLLVGDCMGAYIATLWASQNPCLVGGMVLMSPAFWLVHQWQTTPASAVVRERVSASPRLRRLLCAHEEARSFPTYPTPMAPTVVIQPKHAPPEVVAGSHNYAAAYPEQVELLEVEDDGGVLSRFDLVEDRIDRSLQQVESYLG